MTVSREAVQENVTERCRRLQTEKINLLQFHWQFVRAKETLCNYEFRANGHQVSKSGLSKSSQISNRR
jgi:aryl-alcohol dehydrogenase-like predicted oxidoreductase